MNQDLFDAIKAPLVEVLNKANLTLSDIDQVELLGGVSRIPKVQDTL